MVPFQEFPSKISFLYNNNNDQLSRMPAFADTGTKRVRKGGGWCDISIPVNIICREGG